MEVLEVDSETVDALSIKVLGRISAPLIAKRRWYYLPYYVARLKISECLEVLLHRSIEIVLGVKMIAIASVYIRKGCLV